MTFARTTRSCFASLFVAALIGAALSACSGGSGTQSLPASQQSSQNATSPIQQSPNTSTTTAAFSRFRYHLYPTHEKGAAIRAQATVNYPADLQNFGGPVLTTSLLHNVYVDCGYSCWGNPQIFLDNLDDSTMIHVVDQYVHSTANYRYRFGANVASTVSFTNSNMLTQTELVNVVHNAALHFGGGYGNVYNVFLPQGVDTCISQGNCYSPDNPANWTFCAYHSSVDFSDKTGHVLFTVEPYQAVDGCATTGGPNSLLVDSTDSTLSHETFETISDPDPDTGWYNMNFQAEMADECASYDDDDFLYEHKYELQEEYSNKLHGCTN